MVHIDGFNKMKTKLFQKKYRRRLGGRENGQVLIVTVVIFILASLISVFGIITPIIKHLRANFNINQSKQAYYLSESGIEDAVFRLKTGKVTPLNYNLSIDGWNTTVVVADTSDGKEVTSTSDKNDFIRSLKTNLNFGDGLAFFYGLQTGTGGIDMSNNSTVNGNVYANGSIQGANGAAITGSAYAANSTALYADQVNDSPSTPTSGIQFGHSSANEDFAQKFQVSADGPINKIAINIKKVSNPGNLTVKIVADSSSSPGTLVLAQGSISSSLVTDTYGWVEAPLSSNPELLAGTTYWLVLDGGNSSSKYYFVGSNDSYSSGLAKTGRLSSTWNSLSPSTKDGYFKIYLGGLTSLIDNVDVGTGGTGDANAHTVTNSTITGNLYCQTGSGNNKACDTSLPDPAPAAMPVSDANITKWKNDGSSGSIINGSVVLDGLSSSSIGPAKIVGDLTVTNSYILTINGTLYVTGNITVSNNAVVRLAPSYGTSGGIIVADGFIDLGNNVSFQNSGQAGSYIMLVTTSDCPSSAYCAGKNAIGVSNNAGTVILNAQSGTISFANNSGAKSAVGQKIILNNGATITYETGLASINFSSGPSGGFDILNWGEPE